jgi:hypothetical protein
MQNLSPDEMTAEKFSSCRVTAGLAAKAAHGCMISLDGEYGGLGASYKIWTGSVRASMPF